MVRRVQVFGQEVEDYPAFAGMSYTWFPSLGGYVEGGVCTDPFFGTRMEVLRKKVKEQTGFEPLTDKESEQLRRYGAAAGAAAGIDGRALADKLRNYWRAEQRLGWGETLALYDRKLHEVRRDLVATMSENAGHDSGKSLADMAGAHDAMSFESYTDFGDWPMSAGFVADWAHGQIGPGKPVWQAVEPSQAEPAIVAKQFYKFARGAEGIANGVHSPAGARSNARRALTNRFLERYGSLVSQWSPDTRVAVCVGEVQFGEYDAHALHSHLTRLGYGPVILSERTLEGSGVPAGLKAVFIPNLRVPFSRAAEENLKAFASRGGKVIVVGENCLPLDGATRVQVPLKTLWDVGGFPAHVAFFDEFTKVRPALEKAVAEAGLSPRNGACPEKAVILPMRVRRRRLRGGHRLAAGFQGHGIQSRHGGGGEGRAGEEGHQPGDRRGAAGEGRDRHPRPGERAGGAAGPAGGRAGSRHAPLPAGRDRGRRADALRGRGVRRRRRGAARAGGVFDRRPGGRRARRFYRLSRTAGRRHLSHPADRGRRRVVRLRPPNC